MGKKFKTVIKLGALYRICTPLILCVCVCDGVYMCVYNYVCVCMICGGCLCVYLGCVFVCVCAFFLGGGCVCSFDMYVCV